jgi:hypothetical protein
MRKPERRTLPLVAWCLVTTATVMLVVSTVDTDHLIEWLLVSGCVLLLSGGVVSAMARARD